MAGVDRYEDLEAWRLSVAIRDRIHVLTEAQCKDWQFRAQIRDASASVPRISLKAACSAAHVPRHVRIARGSLAETRNPIQDAAEHGIFTSSEGEELLRLTHRALARRRDAALPDSLDGEAPANWPARPSKGR